MRTPISRTPCEAAAEGSTTVSLAETGNTRMMCVLTHPPD
jgi:hypothetical protein